MAEKDLRPTRYLLTLRYATTFIKEFFEQNPISQLGIIGMRDGLAIRVSDLSGNSMDHLTALSKFRTQDPQGNPSLQNGLEMARAALFHAPSHGTREILIIYGALLSSDPGDIHDTINSLIKDRIRVSIIGLAAEVAICTELCKRTNNGDTSYYSVALDERHFQETLMGVTTPQVVRSAKQSQSSLLMMGFPSKTISKTVTLCACHSKLSRGGYLCSRCGSKVCSLPAECPACGLTLILSTHLARSYHHLFPLDNFLEVPWVKASQSQTNGCYSCGSKFPVPPSGTELARQKDGGPAVNTEVLSKGMSESGRYACRLCHRHFCIDCDVFAHEVVHNCPGCQGDIRGKMKMNGSVKKSHTGNGGTEEDIYGTDDVKMN
jgi:transcription initiation factor TFIIH subunit 2